MALALQQSLTAICLFSSILLLFQNTIVMCWGQDVPFPEKDPNFLFLGNSYVNFNNLPSLVKNLLEAGVPEWDGLVEVKRRDPGGERFTGHLAAIQDSQESPPCEEGVRRWLIGITEHEPIPFQWIVLQEQSQIPGFYDLGKSSGGNLYEQSLEAAKSLNQIIAGNGAQTLFFMTWGRRHGDQQRNYQLYPDFLTMQRYLSEGYMRYARDTSTEERPTFVAPAGLVFETIYNDEIEAGNNPTHPGTLFYNLYTEDGSHPSIAGSYVAALTIYTTITGKNPKEVVWFPPNLDMEICQRIQDAVSRTILETYESQAIDYPWLAPWPNYDTIASEL